MPDKPLIWLGSSLGAYRTFLPWRDGWQASSFGGCSKGSTGSPCGRWARASGRSGSRLPARIGVFYVATRPEAIYVLHAFEKKTQKTSAADLRSGRERLRTLEQLRQPMTKKGALKVTPSTGNVFRDLGFSKEESEHLLVRADLLIQLQKAIAARGLKQAEAAKVLRATQPRVSDLLRGRIDLFSTDALIDMLARLGIGVRLVVKAPRSRKVA